MQRLTRRVSVGHMDDESLAKDSNLILISIGPVCITRHSVRLRNNCF